MQDISCDQMVPLSQMLKEAYSAERRAMEGCNDPLLPEASSPDQCYGSCADTNEDGEDFFPGLTAFLSQDEINKSLDLAMEAFGEDSLADSKVDENYALFTNSPFANFSESSSSPETKQICYEDLKTAQESSPITVANPEKIKKCQQLVTENTHIAAPKSKQMQNKDVLVNKKDPEKHPGPKAPSFIEELSSIFRSASKQEQNLSDDSSSPDSGYLSPKNQENISVKQFTAAWKNGSPHSSESNPTAAWRSGTAHSSDRPSGTPTPPHFTQKLKSQEVAEGNPVRLECRVSGNPEPLVRWFCEGKELSTSPDIQICKDGDLHTLVISEAFEDDTGRYTCTATNSFGSDNTSAEVYVEGASSSDSEGEISMLHTKLGDMPQVQKKTTSVSLTIGSPSPKNPKVNQLRSTLIQPLSTQRTMSPVSSPSGQDGLVSGPPVYTKPLQNVTASEGQVVVLECRVKGTPPLQVQWFRQGEEILDSPDFRILQKKPRSAAEPEEICTLVISETFPEDGGIFTCTASNQYGSVTSTAELVVCPVKAESTRNGVNAEDSEDFQDFPPPPPLTEISSLELPPKKNNTENVHVNELEIWPSVAALQLQLTPSNESVSQTNGIVNGKKCDDQPAVSPSPPEVLSPMKEPPPLLTKPKLDPEKLKALHEQVLLEQQALFSLQQLSSPPSPPLPPPPSFQELESSQQNSSQISLANSHGISSGAMQTTSTFNYARPKQFIAAQNAMSPSSGYLSPSSGSSCSSLTSPPTSHKQFSKASTSPFQHQYSSESEQPTSPSSPSFPPPPPPFLSPTSAGALPDFPLPPPPPPLPLSSSPPLPSAQVITSEGRNSPFSGLQSPAGFLSSVLPSQPPTLPVNSLGLPKGGNTMGFPKKNVRSTRIASDSEIQGTKDAVIQDLERKLRFKEERFNNGQQEYKVSSFEQRLISEIEYRLERSSVEESDDEVQHEEGESPGEMVAPFFDIRLKHYKVFEGMPVTFTCRVIGDPKPKIYWFKDGKQISKRSEHYKITREPDGTCSLHIAAVSLDDDGNYTIMSANPEGRTSCTGRMMVQAVNQRGRSPRSPPGHIRRPRSRSRDSGDENDTIQERHFRPHFLQAPGDMIVQEGKLCRMDCKVNGLPTPDLIWQLNGHTITPDNSHKMLVRENGVHSLIIEPCTARDAGIYTCIATNRAGQNSFTLELIVAAKEMHKAPAFIEKLQNTGVAEGYPVRMECRVSGVPFPQIYWKKENESLTHNTERISMHQDNHGYICMIIQPATKEDAGWYTVSAKNEAGIISSTARLDVYTQWQQQSQTPKLKKVRPSASRYAALTEKGLDVKAAFFPESSPVHLLTQPGLVESDDL
ncbi:palladin isoform X2 [Erpetoichthys calabaricus]|uniref:palladin isoform X2 n=1 Tax=Erpetoichthys calabaricus TaxID=27687 RepID=UPI0022346BC3|nr:palladin isoform X2 [Erpetoichthys calabaricus]